MLAPALAREAFKGGAPRAVKAIAVSWGSLTARLRPGTATAKSSTCARTAPLPSATSAAAVPAATTCRAVSCRPVRDPLGPTHTCSIGPSQWAVWYHFRAGDAILSDRIRLSFSGMTTRNSPALNPTCRGLCRAVVLVPFLIQTREPPHRDFIIRYRFRSFLKSSFGRDRAHVDARQGTGSA